MQNLPIHNVIAEIKQALNRHHRVVLQAPPGAGKTTAVPLAFLDQPWLQKKQIIILEPRRLAARNAASRMAFLLDEKVGQTVGYQIRQDRCFTERTKILVLTEGILTRKLQADPELKNTALVIFDEFHERNLHADLSLALCLQSQQILREDLKVLVMSATLNTQAIVSLLQKDTSAPVPLIQSEGRSFPVVNHYLDKAIKQNDQLQLLSALTDTVKQVIHNHNDNCLVFLPGVKEINQLLNRISHYLQSVAIDNILLAPLHGSLSKQQQDQAIKATPQGLRKIVLATNIAETSLTIDGISCVIDSGLERLLDYSPASGMNRLTTQLVSQDSTEQRSGRAGRLSPGSCYRLWTQQQQKRLQKHSLAEILHSDLSSLLLELANWGVQQVDELQWLDLPPSAAVEQAKSLLMELDAISSEGKITAHGRDMLRLGTHPRLAHMMLSAIHLQQAYHACLIASILTEKDLFLSNAEKSIDIHERLNILMANKPLNKHHRSIDQQQCRRLIATAVDFLQRLKHCSANTDINKKIDKELSGVLLAYAYPERIARQRAGNESHYLLSNGKGAVIPDFLQHHRYEFLVIANLDAKKSEASIYLGAEISAEQLQDYCSARIQDTEVVAWNPAEKRVETKQIVSIGKIVLQETAVKPEDKTAIHLCLLQAIKQSGLKCFNWTDQAINLQQRVQFINSNSLKYQPVEKLLAQCPLPDFSEEHLLNTLNEWLLPFLKNENSFRQCQKINLHNILFNQLSWQQQQLVDQLAPEAITVPSGSSIRIDYSDRSTPVLAVRLQEVFGLNDTPHVLSGNIKLMMHLLSPARRPMQVTQDLKSFWNTTYHDVKKELRGKYKRHYWPDDPFTATATSRTKKQMDRSVHDKNKS